MALPLQRPVIDGGGPPTIVPHQPHIVMQLDTAIERGELPYSGSSRRAATRQTPARAGRRVARREARWCSDAAAVWRAAEVQHMSSATPTSRARTIALQHSACAASTAPPEPTTSARAPRRRGVRPPAGRGPLDDDRPGHPCTARCASSTRTTLLADHAIPAGSTSRTTATPYPRGRRRARETARSRGRPEAARPRDHHVHRRSLDAARARRAVAALAQLIARETRRAARSSSRRAVAIPWPA